MSESGDFSLPALEEEGPFTSFPPPMSAAAGPGAALAEISPLPALEGRNGGNGKRAAAEEALPLRRILEAILFAVDRPVTVEQLLFAVPGVPAETIEAELEDMAALLKEEGRGYELVDCGGYQLRTNPELHDYVTRFLVGKKRTRLSRAAMETLAIIAYRQPITRGTVEEIRGVDCGQVLHTLLERDLVAIRGRSQALGRPLLYGTTQEFLYYFGISSLADLPSPEELTSLLPDDPLQDPEVRREMQEKGLIPGEETAAELEAEPEGEIAEDPISGPEGAESGSAEEALALAPGCEEEDGGAELDPDEAVVAPPPPGSW